jgi:DNA polymerase III alpha subunit
MGSSCLHFRSYYSLLRGCRSPDQICRFAREHGVSAVGMADINNFYGLIAFLLAAGRHGVRPVPGVVIRKDGRDLLTAYVMSRAGFSAACRALTGMLTDAEGAFDPVAALADGGWEGLSILSAHPDVLDRLARRGREGLYVRLDYGRPFSHLAGLARDRGLPAMAVNETAFLDETDARLFPLLRAMDLNVTLERVPPEELEGCAPAGAALRYADADAMARFFSAVPEALANADRVAREADATGIISPRFVFPSFDGLTEAETFGMLRRLCAEGADRRYGGMRPDISARLDYELAIIREKGFASYFLVVRDIVRQCPRTCGRGSAASSIVSYLLGITHVDPLRYNLFFERFLNRGRNDPPDIDVDFPWDEREKTLRYVFDTYPGRAGMVANHVTFGPRSAVREPAKAMGLPEDEQAALVRAFLQGRSERIPPFIREAAARIRGFPRNLGTHCGGVVITPGPITDYTHVQTSALGWPLIAWEKDATEEAGLVKIDLLGNRSLAVLRDTLELVERGHGRRLEWESFNPLEDPATRDLIAGGGTLGVFYVESPATRQLLTKMRTGDYEHLVIASSIIRPAANQYIQTFVKRLHGAPYRPLHPLIEGTLAETYGVMVYQEDVSRVAMDLAGFPIEDADRLRKILSKKDRELKLPDFRERFFKGARGRGVADPVIQRVWDMILSFDGYSFCKAHSASYAQVSYRVAWLKRFYPLEFMASVINNGGGFYGRQTYVDECRRMGFPILPPDVNASRWEYTVERAAAGAGCVSTPSADAAPADAAEAAPAVPAGAAALRVGLGQLKDVRREAAQAIVEERDRGGPYAGFADFLRRTPCRFEDVRILIRSGALDSVSEGLTRPQLFFRWLTAGADEGLGFQPPPPPQVGDYPARVKLADELATLGIVVSQDPVALFRPRIQRIVERRGLRPFITSADIPGNRGRRVWIAGVMVTAKEVVTHARQPMIFVSFADELAVFETVLFPDAFQRFHPLLDDGWAFLVHGRVQDDLGALAVSVESLVPVSRRPSDTGSPGAEMAPVLPARGGEPPAGPAAPAQPCVGADPAAARPAIPALRHFQVASGGPRMYSARQGGMTDADSAQGAEPARGRAGRAI